MADTADQHAEEVAAPECPVCGEILNEDWVSRHLWLWHGGPNPEQSDGSPTASQDLDGELNDGEAT